MMTGHTPHINCNANEIPCASAHISSAQGVSEAGAFRAKVRTSKFLEMISIGAMTTVTKCTIEVSEEIPSRS